MMFGTEYPTIVWEPGQQEIEDLVLRDNVKPLFFSENACRAYQFEFDVFC